MSLGVLRYEIKALLLLTFACLVQAGTTFDVIDIFTRYVTTSANASAPSFRNLGPIPSSPVLFGGLSAFN